VRGRGGEPAVPRATSRWVLPVDSVLDAINTFYAGDFAGIRDDLEQRRSPRRGWPRCTRSRRRCSRLWARSTG